MESPKILFLVFFLIAMAVACAADTTDGTSYSKTKGGGGGSYGYGWGPRWHHNCRYNPKVCKAPWSPGPNCCNGRCVDLSTCSDSCGRCSNKCAFSQICCGGKCVNPYVSKDHCGRCNNKCTRKGSHCKYGMCSYA